MDYTDRKTLFSLTFWNKLQNVDKGLWLCAWELWHVDNGGPQLPQTQSELFALNEMQCVGNIDAYTDMAYELGRAQNNHLLKKYKGEQFFVVDIS